MHDDPVIDYLFELVKKVHPNAKTIKEQSKNTTPHISLDFSGPLIVKGRYQNDSWTPTGYSIWISDWRKVSHWAPLNLEDEDSVMQLIKTTK